VSEEHRYGDVASATLNQGLTWYEKVYAERKIDSAGLAKEGGVNTYGATFEYEGAPGLEAFERFPFWGFGYEHVVLSQNAPHGLNRAFGGLVLNLNESVTDRWDVRVEDAVSRGSDVTSFASATDSFQADANDAVASLRYLHAPFGKPGYQLS